MGILLLEVFMIQKELLEEICNLEYRLAIAETALEIIQDTANQKKISTPDEIARSALIKIERVKNGLILPEFPFVPRDPYPEPGQDDK